MSLKLQWVTLTEFVLRFALHVTCDVLSFTVPSILQEAYLKACGLEASPATALTCRLMVNSLRWAAGLAADGSNGTSFRLAMFKEVIGSTALNAIKIAAVREPVFT